MKKELQEKILQYKLLEDRLKQLAQQRSLLLSKLPEMEATKETLDEVLKSKENEILVSIGSATYAKGKLIKTDKVIVEVGANVALEKSIEGACEILEKRKKNLESAIKKFENEINVVYQTLIKLEPEIRRLSSEKSS